MPFKTEYPSLNEIFWFRKDDNHLDRGYKIVQNIFTLFIPYLITAILYGFYRWSESKKIEKIEKQNLKPEDEIVISVACQRLVQGQKIVISKGSVAWQMLLQGQNIVISSKHFEKYYESLKPFVISNNVVKDLNTKRAILQINKSGENFLVFLAFNGDEVSISLRRGSFEGFDRRLSERRVLPIDWESLIEYCSFNKVTKILSPPPVANGFEGPQKRTISFITGAGSESFPEKSIFMNSVNKVVSLGTSCLNTCFSLFKRIYNFSGSFFNPSSPVSKKEELEKSVNTMEEQEKKASEESVNTQEKPLKEESEKSVNTMEEQEKKASEESVNTQEKPLKEESEKSVNTQEKPLKEESEKSVNTMEKQENPPIEKPLIEKNRETNLPNTYLPNEDEVNKCDAEVAQKKQNTPPRDQFFQEVFKKAKGLSEEDNYSVFVNYVFKKFIPSDVQEFKSDVQEFKLDEDTVGKQFTMTLSQKRTSNAFPMKWKGLGPNVTFSFPKKIQVSAAFEYKDGSPMYRIIFSGSPITAEGVGTGYTVSATLKEIVFDGEGVSLITGNEKCSGKNKFMTVPINLAIENAKENGIFIKPQVFEKYFEPLTWLK